HPDQFFAQLGIVAHRFAHKVVNRACGFHARQTATCRYKGESLPMYRRVSTQARLFEQPQHTGGGYGSRPCATAPAPANPPALALKSKRGVHRRFFEAGGTGILAGDAALSYGPEGILETYYDFELPLRVRGTLDYQFVNHPAYNRDRGP